MIKLQQKLIIQNLLLLNVARQNVNKNFHNKVVPQRVCFFILIIFVLNFVKIETCFY